MIANPIIQRELVTLLRSGRSLAIQFLLVAGLTGIVWLMWPQDAKVNLDGRQAQQLFQTFAFGMLVGLVLLAPVFPATSIVRERHGRTLQLLLTSRLTPMSILVGKVSASISFVLLLLIISLPPAVAATYVMGGVDAKTQVLPAYGVLALVAVQYAILGLVVSSFARSTDGALRLTYGLILLFTVLVLIPFFLLSNSPWLSMIPLQGTIPWVVRLAVFCVAMALLIIRPQWLTGSGTFGPLTGRVKFTQGIMVVIMLFMATDVAWFRTLSPIPALLERMGQADVGLRGLKAQDQATWMFVINALALTVTLIICLAARLRPALMDVSRDSGQVTDEQSSGVQWFRRIMFLWFFDPQRRSGAIGDLTNPVMAKEFRSRSFGRSHWVMRMVSACLIISLGLALVAAATQGGMGSVGSKQWVSADFLGAVLVLFQMGLVILVAPALSTALISSELEAGSWQLLQMTRLRPMQIVAGKLLSALWSLVLLLVATIPGYAVLLLIREEYTTRVWQVLVVLALTSLFAVLLGAMCSSLFRRTTAATTAAYILIVALCVGTLLPWLGEGTLFGRDVVATALKVNPVAAALSIIQMPGLADYQLVPFIWQFLAGASLFCAIVLWIRTWQLTRPS